MQTKSLIKLNDRGLLIYIASMISVITSIKGVSDKTQKELIESIGKMQKWTSLNAVNTKNYCVSEVL